MRDANHFSMKGEPMTTLAKLKAMKDQDIQNWLRRIGSQGVSGLVIALLGADEEVHHCVYRNMSERARTVLKEDLDKYRKQGIQQAVIRNKALELEKLF